MFEFILMIKKRINSPVNAELFLLVNGRDLLCSVSWMIEVYKKYKDPEDGFLYIAYASELTWGKI